MRTIYDLARTATVGLHRLYNVIGRLIYHGSGQHPRQLSELVGSGRILFDSSASKRWNSLSGGGRGGLQTAFVGGLVKPLIPHMILGCFGRCHRLSLFISVFVGWHPAWFTTVWHRAHSASHRVSRIVRALIICAALRGLCYLEQ